MYYYYIVWVCDTLCYAECIAYNNISLESTTLYAQQACNIQGLIS